MDMICRVEAQEHALELALFIRTTRGFALTPQGQALLAKIEAVEVEATRLTRELSGSIQLTALEALMTHTISPIMLAYRMLHPEVRFENLSAEHRVSLEKGEADIAFRAANGELSGDRLNMAGAVRAGLGVGLLPLLVGNATPGLALCFPPPVETDSQWWLVVSPDAYQQPRVRSFMAFAADRIRQDKSGGLRI